MDVNVRLCCCVCATRLGNTNNTWVVTFLKVRFFYYYCWFVLKNCILQVAYCYYLRMRMKLWEKVELWRRYWLRKGLSVTLSIFQPCLMGECVWWLYDMIYLYLFALFMSIPYYFFAPLLIGLSLSDGSPVVIYQTIHVPEMSPRLLSWLSTFWLSTLSLKFFFPFIYYCSKGYYYQEK